MNYSNQSISDLEKKFKTSAINGLTQQQAEEALKIYGKNSLNKKKSISIPHIILQQFINPLVYILLVSAVVISFTGTLIDACIVLFIVLLNGAIGAIQELRLAYIVGHLNTLQKRDYIVIRDGKKVIIAEESIVPGDIVNLQDGQKIPADGRLIAAFDLVVDESMLTGESRPVNKIAEDSNEYVSDRLDAQHGMVFAGTSLISGYGQILVTAIGKSTESGKIQAYIPEIVTDLPLQKDLTKLIRVVLITIVLICVTLLILGLIDGKPFGELFAALLALFMCAVPQGLPVIMTLILAVGSFRLAKHHILAKRLHAVEALGRADILVVDKTGTLTSNQLMVSSIVADNTSYTVTGSGYDPKGSILLNGQVVLYDHDDLSFKRMLEGAYLLNRSQITFSKEAQRFVVKGNPNEAALGICAKKAGIPDGSLEERFLLIYEIPFHAETQFHACFYKDMQINKLVIYATGSFEGFYKQEINSEKFSQDLLDQALAEGKRIMAFGYGEVDISLLDSVSEKSDNKKDYFLKIFKDSVTSLGFFEVEDALRKDIALTVKTISDAGIRIIMATGDHVITAEYIAEFAGIFKSQGISKGAFEMTDVTDGDLKANLKICSVYGRCLPADKLRIITFLQEQGFRVAMVGDGVNDVPSLAMSDLGVAMGISGTDSAKEAADIVLLQDSFDSIPYGIAEGRHIFYTFKRVIFYFLASNFTEVLVMTVAFIGFPLPLLASHVLWLNLVTDGFLDASLSLEEPENNLLDIAFKKNIKTLISFTSIVHIVFLAAISASITAIVFIYYLNSFGLEHARTMCMATLTGCQMINAINARSLHKSIFKLPLWGNPWLYAALLAIFIILLLIIYVPMLQVVFKTIPLYLIDWIVVCAVALILFGIEELRKKIF